jgi:hypothetical protein
MGHVIVGFHLRGAHGSLEFRRFPDQVRSDLIELQIVPCIAMDVFRRFGHDRKGGLKIPFGKKSQLFGFITNPA